MLIKLIRELIKKLIHNNSRFIEILWVLKRQQATGNGSFLRFKSEEG